jgi:ribosomal protein S27AE
MPGSINQRIEKWCPACSSVIARELFAKNRNRPDGMGAYCLACNRRQQAAERARRGDDYRQMRRLYRATERGIRAYSRYVPTHPWQKWAQGKVWNEIERGRIVKPEMCSSCGNSGIIDGHHDDYAKPLNVRWLCRWCHREWHRINGEAANATISVVA